MRLIAAFLLGDQGYGGGRGSTTKRNCFFFTQQALTKKAAWLSKATEKKL